MNPHTIHATLNLRANTKAAVIHHSVTTASETIEQEKRYVADH
jgi:hypothetical protein